MNACVCVCGIVGRDLKMENIMLDESLRNIKLIGETASLIRTKIRRNIINLQLFTA